MCQSVSGTSEETIMTAFHNPELGFMTLNDAARHVGVTRGCLEYHRMHDRTFPKLHQLSRGISGTRGLCVVNCDEFFAWAGKKAPRPARWQKVDLSAA